MESREDRVSGLIFVALMFIGAGIGLLFERPDVGGAIGMGLGFLAMALIRAKYSGIEAKRKALIGPLSGAFLLALTGVAFLIGGVALLLGIQAWNYIGGVLSIAFGLAMLAAAFKLVSFKPS